jgi:hypothetical protein
MWSGPVRDVTSVPLRPAERASDHKDLAVRVSGDDAWVADLTEWTIAEDSIRPDLQGAHQTEAGSILSIMIGMMPSLPSNGKTTAAGRPTW